VSQAERNVEIARDALAAFSSGDFGASLATMHPDVEWHVFIPLPDLPQSVYRGTNEVRMIWTRLTAAFEVFTAEIEEILHADDERLLFRGRFRARGAESGIEVDRVVYYHFRIADGLLAYIRGFADETTARRDAGLDVE
jgi:ketosteroid isomerase-like protein